MGTRPRIPYMFLRLEHARGERGDLVRFEYHDEHYAAARRIYDGQPCGFVDADAVDRFSQRTGMDSLVGIITRLREGGRGVVGLLRAE